MNQLSPVMVVLEPRGVSGKLPPGKLPPGKFSSIKFPPGGSPLGKFPPGIFPHVFKHFVFSLLSPLSLIFLKD